MYLSDNLKYLRKQKEISADELAKIINKSRMTIFDYESGRSSPPVSILLILCKFYDIDLNSLVLSNLQNEQINKFNEVKKEVNYDNINVREELVEMKKLINSLQNDIIEINKILNLPE